MLIEDKHYLSKAEEVEVCPGDKTLLENACQENWTVVIVTNQSGTVRGYFSWQDYELVADRMLEILYLLILQKPLFPLLMLH